MHCVAQNACSTVTAGRQNSQRAVQSALGSVDHKAIVPILLHHVDLAIDEWVAKIVSSSGNRQANAGVALTVARSCQSVH